MTGVQTCALPISGKFALIVTTLAGGGVLLFVVVGLTLALVFQPFMQSSQPYSSYTMLSNGTIYKTTYQDNELLSVVNLEGQPLLDSKTGKPIDRRELQNRTAYGATVLSELDKPNPFGSRYIFYPFTIYFNLWNVVDKKLWYVDRHGRLIGYDGVTRKFIGTIAPHGLDGVAEKFLPLSRANGGYFYNNYYSDPARTLVSARTVYEIDLKSRAISPVHAVTNGDEIGGFANSARNYPDVHGTKPILITTRKSITLLKSDGGVIFEIPYAPSLSDYPRVELFSLWQPTNGFALELDPDYNLNAKRGWKMPEHYVWIGTNQTVARTLDLPILHNSQPEPLAEKVATSFVPPALLAGNEEHPFKLAVGLSLTWTLACVGIGFWLARRYNFSPRATAG